MKYIINQFGNIIGIVNEQGQTFMKEEEEINKFEHSCPKCGSTNIESIPGGDIGCNNCGEIW